MKSVLPLVPVLLCGALGAGCVVVDSQGHITREEKRFTVSGTPDLKLTTFDGSIQIRSGSDREIVVEIEKRGPTQEEVDRLKVETRQDGNTVTVEVKRPAHDSQFGFGFHSTPTARLIVTMPKSGNVIAKSGDGSIRIEDISGKLDLRTGDGSIRANRVAGDLTLQTGDGSVALDGVSGRLDLETNDGSVTIAGKPDVARVHTGDGSITFRAEDGTKMTDDWSMTTGDGSIALYLPDDFAAELDASTGDGTIRSELNVAGAGDERQRRSLRGTLGAGGRQLRLRTGDGTIKLRSS